MCLYIECTVKIIYGSFQLYFNTIMKKLISPNRFVSEFRFYSVILIISLGRSGLWEITPSQFDNYNIL
jgi:hypothetical protein